MGRKRNNNTKPEVIARRQDIVATLTARRYSQREIATIMQTPPPPGHDGRYFFLNPVDNLPWSLATVNADVQAIREQWRANAQKSFGDRQADLLAEIQEVRKRGWQKDEMGTVQRSIDQEAGIFGVTAPQQLELSGRAGGPVQFADVSKLSDDELQQFIVRFGGQLPAGAAGGSPAVAESGVGGPGEEGTAPPPGPDQP